MCSTAETTMRVWPLRLGATPFTARLFASVAPEVKMIPPAAPPQRRATFMRAASSDSRASAPRECRADGLPLPASRNGRMTASTRGSTGAKPA
jgi:hypothetical protein